MIRGLQPSMRTEEELDLLSLDQRRSWGDLRAGFQYLKGAKKYREGHIRYVCCDRTKENGFKLKDSIFTIGIRKKFFTVKVVMH